MCTDLLPLNIDPAINTLDRLGCERLSALEIAADELLDIGDPMRVDARYLDALAEEMQTYFLTGEETEDQKRRAVANSFMIHRKKGTPLALERAFDAYDLPVIVREWYDYGGEPYYFALDVDIEGMGFSAETVERITALVGELKNVRSTLDYIQPTVTPITCEASAIAVSCGGETVTIAPYYPDPIMSAVIAAPAVAVHAVDTTTIYPKESA
jgi:phage tail P2-like protein